MKRFTSSWLISLVSVSLVLFAALNARADKGEVAVRPVVAKTGSGTVKGDRINVRSRPTTSSEVVAQLSKGSRVEIRGSQSTTEGGKPREWLNIVLPEQARCFVLSKHLTAGAANSENLYVRCGPGANYRDVGKLPKGEKVSVVKTQGDWTQIKPTPACTGWVAAEWIELDVIAPAPAPAPPVTEVAPAPMAPPVEPAPAAEKVKVVSTDPDVHVVYSVKVGVLQTASEQDAPAKYELMTEEVQRLEHLVCYVEAPADTDMARYQQKRVRISGNLRWYKGDRYPILAADRIAVVW